jgi:hypothetical protein
MRRKHQQSRPHKATIDAALAAISVSDLREIVATMLIEVEGTALLNLQSQLVARAARGAGWVPPAPRENELAETLAFAKRALAAHHAHPADMSAYLQCAQAAFFRKDYARASQIYAALLEPIATTEIDVEHHEHVDETLGNCVADYAAQYAVCTYMLAQPSHRVRAVHAVVTALESLWCFNQPLRNLQDAAIEPLPDFDAFKSQWSVCLPKSPGNG